MSNLIKGRQILVIGRAGLDLYPEPIGSSLEEGEVFRPVLGGSAGNIAAGLGRLGMCPFMLSKVSDDAIGRRVLKELTSYGVATDYVGSVGGDARVSLAFAENRMEGHQVVLYRNEAADFFLNEADIEKVDFADFDALILTGTALAREPSRGACFLALKNAKAAGVTCVIDLDYRAPTWASEDEAKEVYLRTAKLCDMIIGNDVEFAVMAGGDGFMLAQDLGATRAVIYKMGEKGAIAILNGAQSEHGIFAIEALKPVGAGDAFMAALIAALANDASFEDAITRGSAHAAMVVARPGCAPAMATEDELENFLQERTQDVYSTL